MKRLILTSIFTFCLAMIFAGNGDKSNNGEVYSTRQIEGKVVDKITGEALAGVALTLDGLDKKYYTDLDGNFSIEGVSPGLHKIDILYVSYKGVTLQDLNTSDQELTLKVELASISE